MGGNEIVGFLQAFKLIIPNSRFSSNISHLVIFVCDRQRMISDDGFSTRIFYARSMYTQDVAMSPHLLPLAIPFSATLNSNLMPWNRFVLMNWSVTACAFCITFWQFTTPANSIAIATKKFAAHKSVDHFYLLWKFGWVNINRLKFHWHLPLANHINGSIYFDRSDLHFIIHTPHPCVNSERWCCG